jgi:hypothetical protein
MNGFELRRKLRGEKKVVNVVRTVAVKALASHGHGEAQAHGYLNTRVVCRNF